MKMVSFWRIVFAGKGRGCLNVTLTWQVSCGCNLSCLGAKSSLSWLEFFSVCHKQKVQMILATFAFGAISIQLGRFTYDFNRGGQGVLQRHDLGIGLVHADLVEGDLLWAHEDRLVVRDETLGGQA